MILFIALMIEFHRHYTRPSRRAGRPGGPVAASLVLACGLALILFLSAIVAMRVARIGSLVDEGREVAASMRKVQHFRGARQKLELELELDGISSVAAVSRELVGPQLADPADGYVRRSEAPHI